MTGTDFLKEVVPFIVFVVWIISILVYPKFFFATGVVAMFYMSVYSIYDFLVSPMGKFSILQLLCLVPFCCLGTCIYWALFRYKKVDE